MRACCEFVSGCHSLLSPAQRGPRTEYSQACCAAEAPCWAVWDHRSNCLCRVRGFIARGGDVGLRCWFATRHYDENHPRPHRALTKPDTGSRDKAGCCETNDSTQPRPFEDSFTVHIHSATASLLQVARFSVCDGVCPVTQRASCCSSSSAVWKVSFLGPTKEG